MTESEGELLNEWFANQRQFKTWNELASYIGLHKRVISFYRAGYRRVVNPDHRALLFKVTKIPAFASEAPPKSLPHAPAKKHIERNPATSHERSSPLVLNGVTLRTREELSEYLKQWLECQSTGVTVSKLARMTTIPESTFGNYFSGHGFPGPHHRTEFVALIERMTSSDQQIVVSLVGRPGRERESVIPADAESELKELLSKVVSKFQELIDEPRVTKVEGGKAAKSPFEHAERVLALLRSLDQELQYFRAASSADRDYLRRIVHGQDVGYITSLLRALYDEDKFQSWQLFSNYQMISKGRDRGGDE